MTVLTTPRLTVRPISLADAAAVFAARAAMPFDPPTRDFAGTQAMIAEVAAKPPASDGWHQFAIVETATAAVLGDIGVRRGHPGPGQAMVGFALVPEARGRGVGTEAVGALVDHLFVGGLHRIAATTDARNIATQRLLSRLRFRLEGRSVASWPEGDAWFDEVHYGRLAGE